MAEHARHGCICEANLAACGAAEFNAALGDVQVRDWSHACVLDGHADPIGVCRCSTRCPAQNASANMLLNGCFCRKVQQRRPSKSNTMLMLSHLQSMTENHM